MAVFCQVQRVYCIGMAIGGVQWETAESKATSETQAIRWPQKDTSQNDLKVNDEKIRQEEISTKKKGLAIGHLCFLFDGVLQRPTCGGNSQHWHYTELQSVPRSEQTVSVIKTILLRFYWEIIAVCSQIHTKHINTAVWAERRIVEC